MHRRPPMLDVDRAVLRNVLIVVLASTASLVLAGTSCLGTQMARLDRAAGVARDPSRSSAGGVPVGSATIASATVDRHRAAPPPPHAPPPGAPNAPMAPNGPGFEVPNLGQPPGMHGMPGMMPGMTPGMVPGMTPGMRMPVPAPAPAPAPHPDAPAR